MSEKPVARKTKTPAKKTPAKGRSAVGARQSKPKAKKRAAQGKKPKTPATVDLVQSRADFVRYFIEQDFQNATGAYRRAYGERSDEVAAACASRLIKDVKVQETMSGELEAVLAEKRRPLEKRILDYWITRAFYDPTEIINLRGELKMTEAQLRKRGLWVVIDGINKKLNAKGDSYMEYKLADRDKAVDMLQKYIAMIKEPDKNVNLNVGSGVLRVAATMSPEEWAKAAIAQQDALMSAGTHE